MVMTGGWFIIVLPTLMIIMGYTWIYHLSTGAGVRNHPQYVCYTDVFLPCPSAVAVPLFFCSGTGPAPMVSLGHSVVNAWGIMGL